MSRPLHPVKLSHRAEWVACYARYVVASQGVVMGCWDVQVVSSEPLHAVGEYTGFVDWSDWYRRDNVFDLDLLLKVVLAVRSGKNN